MDYLTAYQKRRKNNHNVLMALAEQLKAKAAKSILPNAKKLERCESTLSWRKIANVILLVLQRCHTGGISEVHIVGKYPVLSEMILMASRSL